MNRIIFKDIMKESDGVVSLTEKEIDAIILKTINHCDKMQLNLFSGAKNAIIVCEEISEFILELQYYTTTNPYDTYDLLEEFADIILSIRFAAHAFGCFIEYNAYANDIKKPSGKKEYFLESEKNKCISNAIKNLCILQKIIIKHIRGYVIQYDQTLHALTDSYQSIYDLNHILKFSEQDINKACVIKLNRQAMNNKKTDWK